MKNLTPTATVANFRVCLLENGKVPVFDGPQPLGRGIWNPRQRRIDDMPEGVPENLRASLSQSLRLAITAVKVKAEEKRKQRKTVSRPSVNTLFREFKERSFPSNFTRWTRVKYHQIFVAIVIEEGDVVFYRNWTFIGKGRWNRHIQFVEHYTGESIPAHVWERIAKGLTEYVVARSKS